MLDSISIMDYLQRQLELDVRFTRTAADRDHIEVHRADGSTIEWEFPTHVSRLPHDLCHLIVEDGLAIGFGFWGLVSRGVDVCVIDDHAELSLGGSPLRDRPGTDFSDLMHSEEAVAVLSPSGLKTELVGALVVVTLPGSEHLSPLTDDELDRVRALFPDASPERIRSVRDRLMALDRRWATMQLGESVTLPFPGGSVPEPRVAPPIEPDELG
jgi:hypothetical protein